MTLPTRFAVALPLLFVIAQARSAHAQVGPSITVVAAPERTTPAGSTASPSSLGPNVINYSDCINDESLTFSLAAKGDILGDGIEAWAGEGTTDCSDISNRTEATAQCWRVGTVDSPSASMTLEVRVQDVLSQFGKTAKSTTANGDRTACGVLSAGPHAIALQFIATNGTNSLGRSATYSLVAETFSASKAPVFEVVGGKELATLTLSTNGDSTITGYDVYCDPMPAGKGGIDAGAQCASSKLVEQRGTYGLQNPYPGPPPSELRCGKGAADAKTATLTLAEGTTYAIAIAPVDAYANHGALSATQCATTQPHDPADDEPACAVTPGPKRTSLAAIALGLAVAAGARRRRQRRAKA